MKVGISLFAKMRLGEGDVAVGRDQGEQVADHALLAAGVVRRETADVVKEDGVLRKDEGGGGRRGGAGLARGRKRRGRGPRLRGGAGISTCIPL